MHVLAYYSQGDSDALSVHLQARVCAVLCLCTGIRMFWLSPNFLLMSVQFQETRDESYKAKTERDKRHTVMCGETY